LANFLSSGQCDGIIALGTGTYISAARIVSLVMDNPNQIHSVLDGQFPEGKAVPVWEIPVSGKYHHMFHPVLPVIDSRSRELKSFNAFSYRPENIIIDPAMVKSISGKALVLIFLDLVTALVESLRYAGKSTLFNDLMDNSMKILVPMFEDLINIDRSKELHEQYTLASYYLSKSIGLSGMGPVMALSFALQAFTNNGRSLINAVLLPYYLDVLAEKAPAAPARITEYYRKEALLENDRDRVVLLADEVRKYIALYNLPVRLRDLGITLVNIKAAVENLASYPHYEKRNRDELKVILESLAENAY
jgi:alcohol dehydrogenase